MNKLQIIGAITSVIGCAISVYLFIFTRKLPTILEDYFVTVEYNEKRSEMIHNFEAALNLLMDDNQPIDNRLIGKLYKDIHYLRRYHSILDKDTQKTIETILEILSIKDSIDRTELINQVTILQTSCHSLKKKGVFYI